MAEYECSTDFEVDIDYEGNDLLGPSTTLTPGECQLDCMDLNSCLYWTWGNDGTNKCWLKDSKTGWEVQDSSSLAGARISGTRLCEGLWLLCTRPPLVTITLHACHRSDKLAAFPLPSLCCSQH